MDRLADFRAVFATVVVARAGVDDPRLRRAFATVPRHEFVGPPPWHFAEHGPPAPTGDPALLYQDVALGLAPDRGITTGLPSLHARCIAAAAPRDGERVTHVGAGAGYFTAILAELVGPTGAVTGLEIDPELTTLANQNLRPWPQARVEAASAVSTPLGPADLLYVSAGVADLPRAWLDALAPGGRLLVPLTPARAEGGLFLIARTASPARAMSATFLGRAQFVPCTGLDGAEASARVQAAFDRGGHERVRSLRFHREELRRRGGSRFRSDRDRGSDAPPLQPRRTTPPTRPAR